MKRLLVLALMPLCLPCALVAQGDTSAPYDTVIVPSGTLKLKGLLWKPVGRGLFPAVLFNHGSGPTNPSRAHILGPVFARHGYVFLFLFRRGDGLSSDQGQFIRDVVARESTIKGEAASHRLMEGPLTKEHLEDALAGLAFLKTISVVDSRRLALAGHSFGGELTLLTAEREPTIRAAVTFGAAARRWDGWADRQERMRAAARNVEVPLMLVHAANDYSIKPAQAMAAERERVRKPYEMKVYPPVGATPVEGHAAVYADIASWEHDVFRFLDRHVRHARR